jgi:hypothetical protein
MTGSGQSSPVVALALTHTSTSTSTETTKLSFMARQVLLTMEKITATCNFKLQSSRWPYAINHFLFLVDLTSMYCIISVTTVVHRHTISRFLFFLTFSLVDF